MRTEPTIQTHLPFERGGTSEAYESELQAALRRRFGHQGTPLPLEPTWLCEELEAAWAWLMADPLAF